MDYIYQDIVDMIKRNLKEVIQRRGAERGREEAGSGLVSQRITETKESIQ